MGTIFDLVAKLLHILPEPGGGGAGADRFVFAARIDQDVIRDYDIGLDSLRIDASLFGGTLTQSHLDSISDTASGVLVLNFGNGDSVTFEGLTDNLGLLSDITLV